MNSETANSCRE